MARPRKPKPLPKSSGKKNAIFSQLERGVNRLNAQWSREVAGAEAGARKVIGQEVGKRVDLATGKTPTNISKAMDNPNVVKLTQNRLAGAKAALNKTAPSNPVTKAVTKIAPKATAAPKATPKPTPSYTKKASRKGVR